MSLIKGEAMWSRVYTPDRRFAMELDKETKQPTGKEKKTGGVWYIEVKVSPENEPQLLKDGLGPLIKYSKDNSYRYIKFERNERNFTTGKENSPPKVVDSQMNPMTELIGNGSIVHVSYTVVEKKAAGFTKRRPVLQAVQVEKLVTYGTNGAPDRAMRKIEGGFVSQGGNEKPQEKALNPPMVEQPSPEMVRQTEDDNEPPFDHDGSEV